MLVPSFFSFTGSVISFGIVSFDFLYGSFTPALPLPFFFPGLVCFYADPLHNQPSWNQPCHARRCSRQLADVVLTLLRSIIMRDGSAHTHTHTHTYIYIYTYTYKRYLRIGLPSSTLVSFTGPAQFFVAYSTVEESGSTESLPVCICRRQLQESCTVYCIASQAG